jgi:hypothetical protein
MPIAKCLYKRFLSGFESDDESTSEMWYVALTLMHQQETIMLESSEEEQEEPNHVERVIFVMS